MWPYGRDLVPYPHTLSLPQNFTVYNQGGNPEIQNHQETNYTTFATYLPRAPYSQQVFPAPYSQQALPAPYSQQENSIHWPQNPIAGDIVLQDQNWLFQNLNRRESMPEYQNGEMVMVKCNQQKWLSGVIQRMSAQGLRIWLADAYILVNVPLVLVPTHVLKMSTFLEIQTLLQLQSEHMWTMTIIDNTGCRKALMQCVRPTHLSHHQLFQKLGCIKCAICKTIVSSIDKVSPWNCSHQVHNYCFQLQMQHSSTSICPSCDEMNTRQLTSIPSIGNGSTTQLMASTSTGIGLNSQLMPQPFTNTALTSPSTGQYQQWFSLQCTCGFRGSIVGVDNMYAPIFCPNCHQHVNINSTTLNMQSGERFVTTNLPHAYSKVDREILQRKNLPDQEFGWPMQQSFSSHGRLEAIEEGAQEGISSMPPSSDYTSLEFLGTNKEHEEPSYLPSHILSFGETFENNVSNQNSVVGIADQNMQPFSSSQSSWQAGLLYEPSGQFNARSSLQGSALTSPPPPQNSLIQNGQTSANSSLQDNALIAPSSTRLSLFQNAQSSARSSLHDKALTTPSLPRISLIQNGQTKTQSSLPDGSLYSPSAQIILLQNKDLRDNAPVSTKLHINPTASIQVNHATLMELEEIDKLSRNLESEPTTIANPDRQKLWRRVSEVDWTRRNFDEDIEESNETSSSNDFAVMPPSTPPVYVNHFANFVNLAMASTSIAKERAKEIIVGASASPSSSTTDPPLNSPTLTYVTPIPAIITPPPTFFTRTPDLVTEAPAIVSPARAFFSQAPTLITSTGAPPWITMANGGDGSPAWITVIKDGVDFRKEDSKQWELLELGKKKKEAKFL